MCNFTIKRIVLYTIAAVNINLVTTQVPSLLAFQANSSDPTNQTFSKDSTWSIEIAPDKEPGEPMIVAGIVYASDGKTPLENIKIHVYHTDAKGIYSPDGNRAKSRIQGDMITNKEGKYQFLSIKPASYPNSRVPSHVHYNVSGPGYPNQNFELRFVGDPYLSKRIVDRDKRQGRFNSIKEIIKGDDGIWRCNFDIKLEK